MEMQGVLDPQAVTDEVRRRANVVARQCGHGRATAIVLGRQDRVLSHVPHGYRKRSTGEYVSNAYRDKAWSSTYYQRAETVVEIAADAGGDEGSMP